MVLPYHSIDRAEDEDKWRKMAVRNNLNGEHIINDNLRNEVFSTSDNDIAPYIPHCAIFDTDGKSSVSAPPHRPENMDLLKEPIRITGSIDHPRQT